VDDHDRPGSPLLPRASAQQGSQERPALLDRLARQECQLEYDHRADDHDCAIRLELSLRRLSLKSAAVRPRSSNETDGSIMRRQALLAALAALGLAPGVVRADDQPIETAVVDALNKAFGVHPGFRANHAKGVVVEGSFTASPDAATLSKAVLFDGSKI